MTSLERKLRKFLSRFAVAAAPFLLERGFKVHFRAVEVHAQVRTVDEFAPSKGRQKILSELFTFGPCANTLN
jgi:hypothetical protein